MEKLKLNNEKKKKIELLFYLLAIIGIFGIFFVSAANPEGPDTVLVNSNTTKPAVGAANVTISGGYVLSINLSANVQDVRWKAFIGQVTGSFTLKDGTGSTIYNWALSSLTGRVYASRASGTLGWASVNCSNLTYLNAENTAMSHNNPNDNLNMTFNYTANATHSEFYVGTRLMPQNTCPTLNTFVNNATQDTDFQEMALYDGTNAIYATIINNDKTGFDSKTYDFQMIVPEIGSSGFSGATPYYSYVEIGS